jgi:hypothetical protein
MVLLHLWLTGENKQLHASMPNFYCLYGLTVQSDCAIPGLVSYRTNRVPDLRVWLDVQSSTSCGPGLARRDVWYESPCRNETGTPTLRVWRLAGGAAFHLRYQDGTEFVLGQGGKDVWASWPDRATLADTATYLLGPVLGFVLRLRGTTCLHASAVAMRDRAVAFLGPAGAGKSTTAAALAQRGHPVLSDDVCALRDEGDAIWVQPGYPHLRLWPDSVSSLFGSPGALPRLTPADGISAWWDKRFLDLDGHGYPFQREPLPLAAIYILGEHATGPGAPSVEPVPAREGLMALVANTYTNYLLDGEMRAREFGLLGRVVAHVPVRRVIPHRDPARLPRLCELVVDDFEELPRQALVG